MLDIIIGFTLPAVYGEDHNAVAIIIVIFLLFRVIRLFRLLEVSDRCKITRNTVYRVILALL